MSKCEKSINSFTQILFLIPSGTLDVRGTALAIKEFLLLSTVGSDTSSIPLVNVWMLVRTTAWMLGRDAGFGGGSGTNCMWGWFTGWGKTSLVSQRLFFTASAMSLAIPCGAPSGTLVCCWLASPPADEAEAISWPVLAGTWRSVARCCVFSAVSAAPRQRLETHVRCALLTAGLFPFGGILGGGKSGLMTHLALYEQTNSQNKNRSNPRCKYV